MEKKRATLHVTCKCCSATLTVDKISGEVLFVEKSAKKSVSFEEAVLKVQNEKETAEDRFREAFQREQSRMNTVDRKFEEIMKHADELEEPMNPLDLD